MSWFLFRVTKRFTDEDGKIHEPGDIGVGMCSMQPGIMEAYRGMMYVVPEDWVEKFHHDKNQRRYCKTIVREAVENYYGITLIN